jgi:hypothetical protein
MDDDNLCYSESYSFSVEKNSDLCLWFNLHFISFLRCALSRSERSFYFVFPLSVSQLGTDSVFFFRVRTFQQISCSAL